MSNEKKRGGFLLSFIFVIILAADVVFAIMYFAQRQNYSASKQSLSQTRSDNNALLSTLGDLRLRLNAAEDKSQKLEIEVKNVGSDEGEIKGVVPVFSGASDKLIIICAETPDQAKIYCEKTANGEEKFEFGAPAGEYYVFAVNIPYPLAAENVKGEGGIFGYYTQKAKCALEGKDWKADSSCASDKILVKVEAGRAAENIVFEDAKFFGEKTKE